MTGKKNDWWEYVHLLFKGVAHAAQEAHGLAASLIRVRPCITLIT
jgi:hypothetical protein